MKIAVIGTGISGNVAAYHLNKEHEITVFEANNYIGGHTHTHDIQSNGKTYQVDSGFIVFNHKTYPNFIKLLAELGVQEQLSTMSFGVKCEKTGLEYMGSTLNSLFAQRRNLFRPSFWKMIREILRFNKEASALVTEDIDDITLGEYLKRGNYSQTFIDLYLIPMAAAVWSADLQIMYQFPARYLIRFFQNHGLLSVNDRPDWYVIKGGSKTYATALTESFKDKIRLSTPVQKVQRTDSGVLITSTQGEEHFDAVFIASHSDQALAMLADPSEAERQVLGAISYQDNEVLLHTDESVMPQRKLAWAAWNYHLLEGEQGRVPVTYNMNILQGFDCPEQFCVTLNNSDAIDQDKVLKRMNYQHPVYTPESVAAQARQAEINTGRTFYCGAYWRYGFHEDGVVSALDALEHFKKNFNKNLNKCCNE
jgi:predicted NAD/FAD-binding protein